jgi:hypothetical protein
MPDKPTVGSVHGAFAGSSWVALIDQLQRRS